MLETASCIDSKPANHVCTATVAYPGFRLTYTDREAIGFCTPKTKHLTLCKTISQSQTGVTLRSRWNACVTKSQFRKHKSHVLFETDEQRRRLYTSTTYWSAAVERVPHVSRFPTVRLHDRRVCWKMLTVFDKIRPRTSTTLTVLGRISRPSSGAQRCLVPFASASGSIALWKLLITWKILHYR